MLKRLMTKQEWEDVKAVLPKSSRFAFWQEIDYVLPVCWTCEHYEGFEGKPGRCKLHEVPIPNEERGKEQQCWSQYILPF